MARFGGPGRPPKIKDIPAPPFISSTVPSQDSDDGASLSGSDDKDPTTKSGTASDVMTASEHDHSYTAPQWLLQEKQVPKFFSIPIPPVATATFKAVQAFMRKSEGWATSTISRKARKQTSQALEKVRQLQLDQRLQAKKVKNQKEKLSNAIARKEQGMEDMKRMQDEEMKNQMKELEAKIRKEHELKYQAQEEEMKQQIEETFNKEFEAAQQKRKFEEMEKKQQEEKQQETEEGEEPDEPDAKKMKLGDDEPKKELESERIQKKIEDCQTKLDKLQEKKSEMVWLLKQVIKADAKRKAEQLKLKKAAAAAKGSAS